MNTKREITRPRDRAIDRLLAVRRTLKEFFADDARAEPIIVNLDMAIAEFVRVHSGEGDVVALAEALDPALFPDETAEVLDAFDRGERYHGGGGAEAEFWLERVRE